MSDVIIIGAGGHAKVIADIVLKNGDTLLGFLDDNKEGVVIGEYSVIGKIDDVVNYSEKAEVIIGIGSNSIRKSISEKYDLKWYTAIHPSAQIGIDVKIGKGTCIMANAVVNSSADVGDHCIINTGAIVEHDCTVSDYVHLSPNATLCGTVNIGALCHVGAGAIVRNNLNVCAGVVVGMGASVVKNIDVCGTYIGVPAKIKGR